MIRNTTKRQKLGWVLFLMYLCLLAYFMFFSESFGRTDTDRGYAYNLVPLKEITRYFRYYRTLGMPLFLINIVGNMVAFMPFGFFLPIISRRSRKWYNTVSFGLIFSLILETLQLIFKVGSFDVDDMLLNTVGAGLGFLVYRTVQRTRVKMRRIHS
ncbi:MAG TPA: VanZ family protein [Candidatus Enterocloster excrementipullorum]|uniref:VanZ family protein n=1 Tax=Candidatus Enterocloster excrementipullorum TaxID=2838559 RepID=A0A9D2N2D5_9FIRM|nr:VanZ family protein [Candidatus Enterocloster excrementipullorum]